MIVMPHTIFFFGTPASPAADCTCFSASRTSKSLEYGLDA